MKKKEPPSAEKRTRQAYNIAIWLFGFLFCLLQPYKYGIVYRVIEAAAGGTVVLLVCYTFTRVLKGKEERREQDLTTLEIVLKSAGIIAVVVVIWLMIPSFLAR